MEELNRLIKSCTRCDLHKWRTNPVPGEGPEDAEVMLVGEAPGYYEDKEGRPFVGAAGKLLDELLESAGLKREEVFIANVLKCRPPGNRDPTDEEIEACTPYLKRQIQIVRPRLIVALGRFAAGVLLGRPVSMGRMHGTLEDCSYGGWRGKVFISYHPAAALYGTSRELLGRDFESLRGIVERLDEFKVSQQMTLGP